MMSKVGREESQPAADTVKFIWRIEKSGNQNTDSKMTSASNNNLMNWMKNENSMKLRRIISAYERTKEFKMRAV